MNFRRSTTANLTETVLHYNALAKDAGISLRSSWPSMASNESISMLGMYGPNQSFNSSGNHVNSQAGPRLVQAGKYCSATANFLTTAGPSLQAGGGNAACSGLTGQRDYLLPKSLAAEVHSSDGFLHGSSTMRLPFLQSASRSINGSAMSGVANLGPSLTHGDGNHIGLSSLASPGRSADHDLHGQNLASGSAMNLQTISSDFGQFFSWVPNPQDPAGEDCWDAAALVSSSNKENGQSRQDSVPAGSYSSSGSEVSLCASKRQRVSWEASCDANVVQDQQLPCTIILDDDMEMLTAASCNYGSAQALLQLRQSRCLLPAESSNGNKISNIPESRLRANRGHNIRDIQAVRGKVSCTASGNSPRSVLAVDSNLQGGTSQLQSTQQQLNVSIATMGTGVYDACTMPFGQTVYQQPCANSQLSQTSHSDMTFAALHQPLDVPATAIASNCQKQVQMDGCADMDAKTTCSSGGGGKPGDVHVTCSSFMEGLEAITSGGRKFQQLPSFSSLGISSGGNVSDSIAPHTKVEFLSPTAHAPKSSSQMYAGDESNLSWPPDSYDRLGASSCPMPTLDSLSSTINGWVLSHADNLLQAGLKTRDAGTWQSKLSTLPTNTAAGRVIANVQEHANNDHNLRKRPSEDFMDSACKRLKDGIKGNDLVTSGPPTRSCSPMTSSSNHKGLGPALNTNLKPRARQGSANDPQSIAARHRRERISERLKMLQDLVPNGSKVDLVTMLEKAISYVKSLQLQVKFLTADEYWPDANKGCTPHVEGISLEVAARMMTESLEAAVKFESDPKGNRQDVLSVMDDSFLMD